MEWREGKVRDCEPITASADAVDEGTHLSAGCSQVQQAENSKPDWSGLVARIRAEDLAASAEFYRYFQPGIRFLVLHYLGPQDADDRVHDVVVAVIEAIKAGAIRHTGRLPAFVRAVAKNQIHSAIRAQARDRERSVPIGGQEFEDGRLSPEDIAGRKERLDQVKQSLLSLPPVDREILTRFYIEGQSKEQICSGLGLTPTQFRLRKSNAKARVTEALRWLHSRPKDPRTRRL